jgi:hypothetical protein
MADGQELESEQLPLVQLVRAFVFETARRLRAKAAFMAYEQSA